jgi:hypothetical protein
MSRRTVRITPQHSTLVPLCRLFLQVGLSRSTTGCVAACLFREFQLSASYVGLIETVPGVNLELLRMDKYEVDKTKDTLFRGEFEVVKELMADLVEDGSVIYINLEGHLKISSVTSFFEVWVLDSFNGYWAMSCWREFSSPQRAVSVPLQPGSAVFLRCKRDFFT